ncbi:MAG: hypothetical protein NC335_12855 [Bacteroides sp.]|nr:hypothetical protein [Bacteroides sp.]
MKFLLVPALALAMNASAFAWNAPETASDGADDIKKELLKALSAGRKCETSLGLPRYEMLDSYFIDKYTGDVYYINVQMSKVEKILLERESAVTDVVASGECVNYQLLANYGSITNYYLLNLNSGDLWKICSSFNPRKIKLQYVQPVSQE